MFQAYVKSPGMSPYVSFKKAPTLLSNVQLIRFHITKVGIYMEFKQKIPIKFLLPHESPFVHVSKNMRDTVSGQYLAKIGFLGTNKYKNICYTLLRTKQIWCSISNQLYL